MVKNLLLCVLVASIPFIKCDCNKKNNPLTYNSLGILPLQYGNYWQYSYSKKSIDNDSLISEMNDTLLLEVTSNVQAGGWFALRYDYTNSDTTVSTALRCKETDSGLYFTGYSSIMGTQPLLKTTAAEDTVLLIPTDETVFPFEKAGMSYEQGDDTTMSVVDSVMDCHVIKGSSLLSSETDTVHFYYNEIGIVGKKRQDINIFEITAGTTTITDTLTIQSTYTLIDYKIE